VKSSWKSECTNSELFSISHCFRHFSVPPGAGPQVDISPPPHLPGLSGDQIKKIGVSDKYLRDSHLKIECDLSSEERDIVRRKRMIYRSKQRGWLEADILLGSWAVENVPQLSDEELDEYELVLKEETIDVYNYVSGKDALPPHLQNLSVMKKLQSYAQSKNVVGPQAYHDIKTQANLT